jgi:tRNA threonylcarbamoyladenosine biosynthesis protein TsaE
LNSPTDQGSGAPPPAGGPLGSERPAPAPSPTPQSRARLDEAALAAWGRLIGAAADPPLFLALRGPLGAGKSVLARAIARGAGVQGSVPSPTFNLLFRYPASHRRQVVHLDLYRIAGPGELRELGWYELGADDEIVLVEWPERAGDECPPDRWEVTLSGVEGRPDLRDVRVAAVGSPRPLPAMPPHAPEVE